MPVSVLRSPRVGRLDGRCVVRPEWGDRLASLGLQTACDFLALPGVVVSGHVGRNVSRVDLDGTTAYLKREHSVRIRDRFRSWRDGFGWVSVSAREVRVLQRLDDLDLPGPRWLAYGESGGQAFLLVEAADGATPLRSHAPLDDRLVDRLGQIIARLHAAGFDQPDLFAKHILVRIESGSLTILDWQRATLRKYVPWRKRIRSLAALRATGGDELFSQGAWDRLLASYRNQLALSGEQVPLWELLQDRVSATAAALANRPGIRSQRTLDVSQELVRIDGETVCAVPAVADQLGSAAAVARLYNQANDGQRMTLADGRIGTLHVRRTRLPFGRWLAALRGRTWRAPELKAARILFHLERHGVLAPKLLAYGQTVPRMAPAGSFVLLESIGVRPARTEDRPLMRDLLTRLHEAGCFLSNAGEALGMAHGVAVVRDPRFLCLTRGVSRGQMRRDFARLDAFLAVAR